MKINNVHKIHCRFKMRYEHKLKMKLFMVVKKMLSHKQNNKTKKKEEEKAREKC